MFVFVFVYVFVCVCVCFFFFFEGGSLLNSNEVFFDDVQIYTNIVYHCLRLSPELIFCMGVVYLGLHIN